MKSRPTAIHHPGLEQLEKIARLMDSQFSLPGTNIRFGLDPLLGFIPYLGELSTFFVSAILATTMARYGGSRKLALLMAGNIIIDGIIGAIPFAGRLFDVFYKANDRNIRLLADHYRFGKHTGNGNGILLIIGLSILVALAGMGWMLVKLAGAIAGVFG